MPLWFTNLCIDQSQYAASRLWYIRIIRPERWQRARDHRFVETGEEVKFVTTIVLLALVATALSLIMGLYSMSRGGEFDRVHSTQYMVLRVGSQAAAFLLLLLALFLTVA